MEPEIGIFSGRFGAGTKNPKTLIHVLGTDSENNSLYVSSENIDKRLAFKHQGTTGEIFSRNYTSSVYNDLLLNKNLLIKDSGRVKIGDVTNNPVEALEITGALRLTGASATQMDGTIIYNTIGSTTDFFGRKQGEWVPLTSINKVKEGGGIELGSDGFSISNVDPLLIGYGSVDKETFFYLTNVKKDIQLQFDDITKQLVFDSIPTENSNNLVRSGAIFSFLDGKQDKFTPESRLDARALGDGGITNRTLSYLINVESDIQVQFNNITNYDTTPSVNSLQAVTSRGIAEALALKAEAYTQDNRLEAIAVGDGSVTNTTFGYLANVTSDIQKQIDSIPGASEADNFPTAGSENFVKSNGIHTRLSEKHPLLTATSTLDPTLIGDGSVSATTFGYLANVNKDIQFQLDNVTDNIVYDNTPIQNSQNPLTSGSLFIELGKKQDIITTTNLLDASFIGDGTIHNQTLGYIRNLKGDIEDRFSEITTIAQDKTPITTYVVTVEGNPKKFYIDGIEAPQLTFIPGSTYRFNVSGVSTANYRFYITSTDGGGAGLVGVTSGITNNGIDFNSNDTMLVYKVPHYPTGKIYYASIDLNNMGNRINVIDQSLQKTDNVTFNDMTVSGNLIVTGTQTVVNTSTITVEDPVITIGNNTTDDNLDRGVEFKYNDGSSKIGFMGWDDSDSRFTLLKDATNTNEVFTGTDADLKLGSGVFSGDITVGGNRFQVSATNGTTSVGGQLFVTGNSSIGGVLNMNSNKITNVTDPTDSQDASTKSYVDSKTQNIPSGAVLTVPKINDSDSSHKYIFAVSDLTADRTITLPLLTGNDEFVFKDHTQTLTNKTLTNPVVTGGTIDNTPIGGTTPTSASFTTINSSGSVTLGSSQTVSGLTNANGGIAVDTDKFTVSNTGNTIIKGTFEVNGSGSSTLGGSLSVTGLTSTAGITASGLLSANAGIAVDTDKFTVADTSGNVSTKGTLFVESTTTLTGDVTVSNLKLNADSTDNKTMTVDATNINATGEGKLVLSASDEVVVTDGAATVKLDGGVISTVSSRIDLDSTGIISINSSASYIDIGTDNVNGDIRIATNGTRNLILGTTTTNLDINSAGANIDSTTLSIDSTDTTNLTMTTNDTSTKTMTIKASNSNANHVGEINMIADGDISIVPGSSDGNTGSSKVLKVDSTASIRVPVGTTAQRNIAANETDATLKAAAKGSIRYNTNTLTFEGYNGGTWGSLGGVKDVDQDTLITSESTPGADEDTLTFQTGGTKRSTMDASGNFDVYNSTGTISKFKVTNAGNTTIGGTLGVSSTSTMTGLLNANGGIAVNTDKFTVAANGNTTTDGTLSSKSDFKVNTNKFVVIGTSGNTTVAGTMDITGDTGIDGDFDIATNKFTVASGTGNTTVAGTMDITGDTGIDGDFDIATNKFTVASGTGNTTVAGTLGVTGLTTTAGITSSGLLNANAGIAVDTNKFTVADGTGNTSIDGTLSVNSTVGISGDTTLNDANLVIKNSGAVDKFKVLAASGNTDIKGTLDTAGDFKVASTKFIVSSGTGNTTISGTLDVTGNTGIDGDFDIATDKFTVDSGTGNTVVAGTLGVTGLTTTAGINASGLLNANGGIATDTDKFTVATNGNTLTKGTLTVSGTGATTLGGNLTVGGTNFQVVAASGNTSIAGTLTSDGNVTVENATLKVRDGSNNDKFTVFANGNTMVGGTLGVTDVSTMTGLLNANGGIAVDTDKFTVATNGNTVTKGTFTVNGTGATELGGSLTVTGTSTFNDNVNISGTKTLTVGTGLTTLGGNLQVDGNLTISGTTTTVNTSTITVEDPVITVGTNSSDDNKDRGVEIKWHDGTGSRIGFFGMDDSTGEFTFIQDATNTNEVFSGTAGNAKFTNMTLGGTLGVTGVSTLSGLLNANGGIAVDTNKFTVADGTGNTAITGTLNVTGNTTVSTLSTGGQIDMNSNKIVNVTDPTSNQDAATKKYVDDQTTSIPANAVLTTPRINDTSSDNYYQFSSSELTDNRTVTLPLLTGDDEFVFKEHTQTLTNKTLTNPDINGGTIDSATIATSDITVGTGKSLNVSAGTLTLADNQISGDKVEGGTIDGITITTLGSTTGNITTVNSTTMDTTNIEVTNIKAKDGTSAATIADSTGVVTIPSSVLTTTDINGGTIDNTTITTSDITIGTGKTLNVSTGTLTLADNQISGDKVEGGTIAGITITTLGSTTGNITTVNSTTLDTTNIEVTNIKAKDGTSAATITDSTGVVTIPSSVLTSTDINGGTIDNTTIATSNITVGAGKTLNVSTGTLTLADDQISGDKVEGGTIAGITITTLGSTTGNITTVNSTTTDTTNIEVTNIKAKDGTSAASVADSTGVMTVGSSVLTTTDINGGTIDSTTIGGTTAAAITGTTITANTNFIGNLTGNVTGTVSSITNHSTSDLSEGTNLYHTTTRARASVSVTDNGGDGSLVYNSTSGVITYTGPSATETRAHFSAGTGVGITGGEVSIGQAVGTTDNVTFGNISGTLTTAAQANITTMTGLVSVGSTGNTTTFSGPILADEGLKVDTISEDTIDSGVTIDGIVLKDNSITASGGLTGNVTGNADTATKIASITNSNIVQLAATQTLTNKTLTSPTITGTGVIAGTFTGDITGDVTGNSDTATKIASITNSNIVQLTATQTLTNKTLTSPTITGTGTISGIFTGDVTGNADTATKIASITNSNIVQLTATQTLTNKTLTSPTITGTGTIAGTFTGDITGDVTGNADTATKIASITNSNIVQLGDTQTLTNKTLTSPTITGTGTIAGTFTGDITGDVTGNADTATKISSITNSNIVQLGATQTLTNKTLTSPTITGTGAIAGTFTGNVTGNVTGTVSSIANHSTSDLSEGTNLYHTTSRARASVSVTDSGGDGSLAYNTTSGVITYTGPSAAETRAHFSNGTGVGISGGGEISIGQAVGITDNVTFGNIAGTLTTVAQGNITSVGTLTGLTVNGSVSANTITINNSATNTNHAVTKGYVDSIASGLDVKKSVRVATTTNGTLASSFANGQTVDGITIATGDRILIKNQTTGSENGIYTVNASGSPTRATDFDSNTEVTSGAFTFVEQGTVNADNGFALTTDGSITVGTTALVFTQFTGAGSITAGSGLSQTGNTIDVNVDGSSLEVSSDSLRVKSGGITNTMLVNSTISFGGVSLALGGTDATPAFNLSDATSYPTSSLTGTITNAQLAGSIANDKLTNNTVSFGGVSLALGGTDATPAFDLSDATGYPTSSLSGTITNAQLTGSIANDKLANNTVSFGGVSLALGATDATPAFDLSDATGYPTSSLTGTITNAQLAGSIANSKLANSTVNFGGVSLALGGSDTTPAFDLSDATNYPTSSLSGTITNTQLAGSIANDKLVNNTVSFGGVSLALGGTDATPAFDLSDATGYPTSSLSGTITNTQLAGSIVNSKLANSGKLNDSTNVFYSEAMVTVNGGKFYVDGTQQQELHLQKGMTYRFNQEDSSNGSHPFRFSTTSNGTHNSGSNYTTGVTEVGTLGSSGSYTQIIVQQDTPTLYYYCGAHSGMGGKAVIDIQEKLTTGSVTNDMLAGTIPITKGGTGATSAAAARTALGVDASGTDNSTNVTLATVSGNYLSLSGQAITAGTVPLSLGGTGATSASAARTALGVDAAGTDNSTDVTLATVSGNYLTLSGQAITAGTVPLSLGGTGATSASTARAALGVDAAGTDNSTDVTLATVSNNYLTLSGQAITAGTVPLSLGGTGATSASTARVALGVDAAGTDNSTDVTLAPVSGNYLTLSGQAITAGTVPLSLGGTGATSASAARTALGAIDGLTVKQDSTTNSNDTTYTSITTLIFDYDAGLQVSNPSTGEAKITLGSHWKTIQIDGTNAVTPSGEETLNLIKGTGINITGNSGSTPQSLTFSINATLNDLSNVSVGSPSTNDVLKWDGSSWVPGSVSSGGATSLNGLSDVIVSSNQITFGSAATTAILPADDNGVDLGSESYSFKDAHIQGVINATKIKTGTPTFTLPTADGSSGQFLKTDGSGTLSWGTASSGGSSTFTGLSDTPSSFTGHGGKFLKVNSTPDAVEFASFSLSDIPSGGASTGQVLKWSGSAWAPSTDNTGSGGGGGGGGSSTGTLGVYNATGDAKVMVETDGSDATDVAKLVLQKGTAVANLSWNGTTLEIDKPLSLGSSLTASTANSDVLLVGSGTGFQVKKTSVALSSLLTTSSSITSVGTLSSLTVSGDATFDTSTLKIDSSNNRVGIGTTSPDEELHVKASGDARVKIEGGSDSGVLILTSNSNDNYIFTHTNGSLYVRTDGSDLLLADNGGNVGIGDTTPSYKLDVNGTGRFTGDLTAGANLTVTGNLTVNGTTTTVSTTNTVITDSLIELNSGASSNANDCGIVIERGSTGNNAFMGWDESADKFLMGTTTATGASTGNLSVTTGTLVVNLEGNVTGNVTGNVSGSAATLTTAREIGGVSFDGSVNISLPGVNTTGNQNTTGSAATLTTARAIGGVSFDGSANISLPGVDTTGNQNTTGSAATLTTARTIGGVSFDGSANINLPGVNTTGNQNTTGNATTATTAATLTTARTIGGVSFDGSSNINLPGVNTTGNQNTTGNATTATTAGTVTTASQPNITSVGTLSSLTVSGDATFDTSTLKVDSSNNRIGIGTTSPGYALEINGTTSIGSSGGGAGFLLNLGVTGTIKGGSSTYRAGFLYGSNSIITLLNQEDGQIRIGSGNSSNGITVDTNNNVGIGDTTPSQKLDVSGNINLTGTISVSGTDLGLEHLSNASVSGNEITLGLTSTTGLLPAQTGTVDLGSSSKKFDVLYASKLNNGVSFTLPTADGTSGQFLKTNGSGTLSWGTASSGGGASALNDLSDVSTSGAQTNYALVYNGSSWAPAEQSGSGGGSSSSEYYSAHIQNISDIDMYSGYIVSSSSTYNDTYVPEYGFSNVVGTADGCWLSADNKYSSGSYIGSESTNGYNGEWLQINFFRKVKVYSYSIISQRVSNLYSRSPGGYKMFGSNNGTSWTEVHSGSASLSDYSTDYNKINDNTLPTPSTYQYFRLVINSTAGSTTMTSVKYLSLKGTFEEPDLIKGAISANVVHQRMTDMATISIAGGSGNKTEIEGLRLTITPQSSFSKLELNYSIFHETSYHNYGFLLSKTVGGTETFIKSTLSTNDQDLTFIGSYDTDGNSTPQTITYSMIDEPNTTGTVIYKVYGVATHSTAVTLYINRTIDDTSSTGHEHGLSTSSVKEFSTFTHNIAEKKVQGRVLETLIGRCDGSNITVSSGTYTLPTAAHQEWSDTDHTMKDVDASIISYKPPPGSNQVVYEFTFIYNYNTNGYVTGAYDFYVDGNKLGHTMAWHSGNYETQFTTITLVVNIGGSTDYANNRIASWDSLKQIKVQMAERDGASRGWTLHENRYAIGTYFTGLPSSPAVDYPIIKIQSIGEENIVYNLTNQYSITEGQTLETLAGVCDGRTVTVSSGIYTLEEVTGVQTIGTTYIDAKGSVIDYRPPLGTRQVIYKFTCTIGGVGTHPICHTKLLVDGTEVTNFRTSQNGNHSIGTTTFVYIFEIGGSDSASSGKFSSWNTNKTIKIQLRGYNSTSNGIKLHETKYWDAGTTSEFSIPKLEIQAIGKGVIEGTIGNLYSSKVNMKYIKYDELTSVSISHSIDTELTMFRISITPIATDSVIELKYNIFGYLSCDAILRIVRVVDGNSTEFYNTNKGDVAWSGIASPYYQEYGSTPYVQPILFYDEPNTTSTVTYKITANSSSNTTSTYYINQGTIPTGTTNSGESGISSVSAIELPQQTIIHNPRYNSVIEQEGQVLEIIAGACDGRSVSGSSGTYTLEDVDSTFDVSGSSWDKITGSGINYKPPPGTRQVIFQIDYAFKGTGGGSFTPQLHTKLKVGTSYVESQERVWRTSSGYPERIVSDIFYLDIGNVSSNDITNGKLASWNTNIQLQVDIQSWSSSYSAKIHATRHDDADTDGTSAGIFRVPKLMITAIGRKSDTTFLNSFFNERKGQVLETLVGVCDGRTVTVDSGTYTLPNVSAKQNLTTTYSDLTGSDISYKPPPGAHRVIYKWRYQSNTIDGTYTHLGYQLYIDDVSFGPIRLRGNNRYGEEYDTIEIVIYITGTDDYINQSLASWDTNKTIKLKGRERNSTDEIEIHTSGIYTLEVGGDSSGTLKKPSIEIQAIGDAAIQNATVVAGHSMVHFQGYSETFTVTNTIPYITGYEDAPSNGFTTGLPVLKNFGNAMNTSTGIFTAPHTGLYSINIVVHKHNNTTYGNVFLVIGDKLTAFGDIKENYDNSGASSVYHLDSGTEVYLKSASGAYPTAVNLSITALQDQVPQALSARPGMTLETLAGVCDGRSVTVSSGTYTLANITTGTTVNGTTYVDFPGSSIAYKPPVGTKEVIYKFNTQYGRVSNSSSVGLKFFIDNTEVTALKKYFGKEQDYSNNINQTYVINIVGTDDIANGRLASWDTLKTLKMKVATQTGYGIYVNKSKFDIIDGTSGSNGSATLTTYVRKPHLEITAIGDGPGIVPSTGMNMVHVSDSTYFSTTINAHTIMHYEYQAMRLVIKPTATDSVIELKYSIFAEMDHDNNFRITRNINGTDVLVSSSANYSQGIIGVHTYDGDFTHTPQNNNFIHYDEPNTTSEITYKVWVGSTKSSNKTIYFNGGNSSSGSSYELGVSKAAAIEYPKTARPLDTENALTIPPFVGAINKEKLYNQSGDLYFNGKQLSNEWYKNGGDLYRLGSNVGIGKSSPAYKLDVLGDINFSGSIRQNGVGFQVGGLWSGSSNVYRSSGMVGFGTSTFVDTTRNPNGIHIANSNGISFQAHTGQTNSRNWRIRNDDMADWGSLQILVSSNNSSAPTSSSNTVMTMLRSGHVGIGDTTPGSVLDVNGKVTCTDFQNTSDRRIKENIIQANDVDVMDKIDNLNLKVYTYTEEYRKSIPEGELSTIPVFGWIAQEVKNTYSDAVVVQKNTIGDTEYEDFHYIKKGKLYDLAVAGVKILHKKNKDLEMEVASLKTTLASQQTLIQSLMSRLEALENP